MVDGPAAGLVVADGSLIAALRDYHLLPSVRGDLLAKVGRSVEARLEFGAARLTANEAERVPLLARAKRTTTGSRIA
jgi:predicted RNA polymerase sigma factor